VVSAQAGRRRESGALGGLAAGDRDSEVLTLLVGGVYVSYTRQVRFIRCVHQASGCRVIFCSAARWQEGAGE